MLARVLTVCLVVVAMAPDAAGEPIALTTVTPGSVPDIPLSPPFGAVVPGGLVTDQYSRFGLLFTGPTALFEDPPLAWGGVNAAGVVDLVSPISGAFVVPGSRTPARTGFISVEIGHADEGTLLLEVFDAGGRLLGSAFNGHPLGPHDRTTATIELPAIASFRISGQDTWGMDQIQFERVAPVPEPSTLGLLATGAIGALVRGRRRRQAAD